MEDRRARGEEHEKCDQTAKKLAKRSVCEGASEAGCMYSKTAENPHLSLMRSNVRRITWRQIAKEIRSGGVPSR